MVCNHLKLAKSRSERLSPGVILFLFHLLFP